ncbi:MAG: hypothetical protein WC829_01250 [Hyphomicrobium sp.]|jgi:hypothetical protein
MALFEYLQQTQRFLREQNQVFSNPEDLISYINRARREVALRTQCIRVLTPSSGIITGYTVTEPGTGYLTTTAPTVTVSAPDFPGGMLPNPNGLQATAAATVDAGGTIVAVDPVVGGEGYFQPTVTISDPTSGTTATAEAVVSGINQLNQGQEKYDFADIDLSANPGCESVYAIRGIAIIYSGYRYSLQNMAWTRYQLYRAYPYQYQYTPAIFAQFGQGAKGSLFVYPLPSQALQAEFDCQCLPSDLIDDQSVEAIPAPWTDAIPYFAASLAFQELQNFNASRYMQDQYEKFAMSYSQFTRIGRMANPYGRP